MGDLLDTEIHPGQSESGEIFYASVSGWVSTLNRILARELPVDTYVPGHGPVHIGRGPADLEEQKRYFLSIRDEVSKLMKAGKSLEAIKEELVIPSEFAAYKRPQRLQLFLNLFYNQLVERGY
jgi:glyoxylase-like metal-dependent hydrolase (beta-lactamase superfamily II)